MTLLSGGHPCLRRCKGSAEAAAQTLQDVPVASGSISAGNPYGNAVWAIGLRNPFTFDIQPSGRIFINDVGASTHEEINEASTQTGGTNFGWPATEGPTTTAAIELRLGRVGRAGGPSAYRAALLVLCNS